MQSGTSLRRISPGLFRRPLSLRTPSAFSSIKYYVLLPFYQKAGALSSNRMHFRLPYIKQQKAPAYRSGIRVQSPSSAFFTPVLSCIPYSPCNPVPLISAASLSIRPPYRSPTVMGKRSISEHTWADSQYGAAEGPPGFNSRDIRGSYYCRFICSELSRFFNFRDTRASCFLQFHEQYAVRTAIGRAGCCAWH